MRLLAGLVILVLGCSSCEPRPRAVDPAEDALLKALMLTSKREGGYVVVDPLTAKWPIDEIDIEDPQSMEKLERRLEQSLQIEGLDVHALLERLRSLNREQFAWHAQPNRHEGYVIDAWRAHHECFEKDGGGWERWFQLNRAARSRMRVSRPVFDDSHRFVLLYREFGSGLLCGSGAIEIFRIEPGRFVMLKSCELWIS